MVSMPSQRFCSLIFSFSDSEPEVVGASSVGDSDRQGLPLVGQGASTAGCTYKETGRRLQMAWAEIAYGLIVSSLADAGCVAFT